MKWLAVVLIIATGTWDDVGEWTQEEVETLLTQSPWVVKVSVQPEQVARDTRLLPPSHAFYDPLTADVLAWQRGSPAFPGLSEQAPAREIPQQPPADYYVRWYSARTVRESLVRAGTLADAMTQEQAATLRRDDDLRYIVSISGGGLERLRALSWKTFEANVELTSTDGARYPLLEAQVNGPEVVLVFDRTDEPAVTKDTESVHFKAHFGDALFEATFYPGLMKHGAFVDIDGVPDVDPRTNALRAVELSLLRGADRGLKRAVRRVEVRENGKTLPDIIVVYDPRYETGELASLNFETRSLALATRVGASGVKARRVWILNALTRQRRWLRGEDCAKLTQLSPGAARVFYDGVVQRPQ